MEHCNNVNGAVAGIVPNGLTLQQRDLWWALAGRELETFIGSRHSWGRSREAESIDEIDFNCLRKIQKSKAKRKTQPEFFGELTTNLESITKITNL